MITVEKERHLREISGRTWSQALIEGLEAARRFIPQGQEDQWRTADGCPSWVIFPRTIPIAWGHEVFAELVTHVEEMEKKLTKR